MPEPAFLYEKRDRIAYLTFNRPAVRNAVNPEALCRLADAWQDYAADDSLRVAIITGAGDRAFTAGADLGTFIPLLTGARQPQDEWDHRVLLDSGLQDRVMLSRSGAAAKNLMPGQTGGEILRRGVYPEPFGKLRTGSVEGLLRMTPLSIT